MAKKIQGSFVRPTLEEIISFINKTMIEWPEKFCAFLGEKMWQTYQARGWQINGRMMKDWQACFHAQWKHLKYKEDKEFLEKCLMEPIHKMRQAEMRRQSAGMFADQLEPTVGSAKPASYYLEFFENMRQSFFAGQLTEKQLRPHYDKLKALGVMRLPKSQIEAIYVEMGNDRDRGKGLSIQQLFLNLQNAGITLTQFYEQTHRQATADIQKNG